MSIVPSLQARAGLTKSTISKIDNFGARLYSQAGGWLSKGTVHAQQLTKQTQQQEHQ